MYRAYSFSEQSHDFCVHMLYTLVYRPMLAVADAGSSLSPFRKSRNWSTPALISFQPTSISIFSGRGFLTGGMMSVSAVRVCVCVSKQGEKYHRD